MGREGEGGKGRKGGGENDIVLRYLPRRMLCGPTCG